MKIKKLLTKYSILLLIYILITKFAEPYALKLYYTVYQQPDITSATVNTIQSVLTLVSFFINLIFVVFILFDSKQKKALDWIIAIITFFSAEIGVLFFIIWQIYKEFIKKDEIKIAEDNNLGK